MIQRLNAIFATIIFHEFIQQFYGKAILYDTKNIRKESVINDERFKIICCIMFCRFYFKKASMCFSVSDGNIFF